MRRLAPALFLLIAPLALAAGPAPLKGVEPGDTDRAAQPCDDFYHDAKAPMKLPA